MVHGQSDRSSGRDTTNVIGLNASYRSHESNGDEWHEWLKIPCRLMLGYGQE
jgi:hypothetical protein